MRRKMALQHIIITVLIRFIGYLVGYLVSVTKGFKYALHNRIGK